MSLASSRKAAEARTVLAKVGSPVEGLEFTRDGMQPFLASARIEYLRGEVEKKLGDEAAAREAWTRASSQHGIFAVLAARELGGDGWKEKAAALSVGRGRHEGASVQEGFALMALGRTAEAREVLNEVLRSPDRNLSHFLARQALATTPGT